MTTEPTNVSNHAEQFAPGLHVLAKPIGPMCDIKCDYCFYLEAHALFGTGENYRMSDEVLSANIRQYVAAQPPPVVEFVWQGVEWNRSPASGTRGHATLCEPVLAG